MKSTQMQPTNLCCALTTAVLMLNEFHYELESMRQVDTKTGGLSADLHPIDPRACTAQWLIWVGTSHQIVSISRELRFVPKSRCCPKTEAFPSC